VVGDADPSLGIQAASFGIDYTGGINPNQVIWTACATGLVFTSNTWPHPGSGLRITENSCINTPVISPDRLHVVFGAFTVYAYSEAVFSLTANMTLQGGIPELAVADCGGHTTDFAELYTSTDWHKLLGRVHLGGNGSQGFTPCCQPCLEATIGSGDGFITLPRANGLYMPVHVKNCSPEPAEVKLYPTIAGITQPTLSLGTLAAQAESLALVPINCTRSDTFLFQCRTTLDIPTKLSCSKTLNLAASVACDASEQVGVEDLDSLRPKLYPAEPNPFSSRARIAFDLQKAGYARVEVFGIRGQLVKRLFEGELNSGFHSITWRGEDTQGTNTAPGIYFVRVAGPQGTSTGRIIRLH
jgi:hypothetical protein